MAYERQHERWRKKGINEPLVELEKNIFPHLHIKLGQMKQFVKVLDKNGACFIYIVEKCPRLSLEKIKAGIFGGPEIRQLIRDPDFTNSMNQIERKAWTSFVAVLKNFLGKHKADNYVELVNKIVDSFRTLRCNISIKVHLHSRIDHFRQNLGDFSVEQGESFHQDIKVMEERYLEDGIRI